MAIRKATAQWEDSLKDGKGHMKLSSTDVDCGFTFGTRFQEEPGSNPEEMIGAALAGCFSMALSAELGKAGYTPKKIETSAEVSLKGSGDDFSIPEIQLTTRASIPEIGDEEFQDVAKTAKSKCPVANALKGSEIHLDAALQ